MSVIEFFIQYWDWYVLGIIIWYFIEDHIDGLRGNKVRHITNLRLSITFPATLIGRFLSKL